MRLLKQTMLTVSLALVIFYLIVSGCAWVTFTAEDKLFDKIAMKSSGTVNSIYLEFSGASGKKNAALDKFQLRLKEQLESKGYQVSPAPESADLVAKFRIHLFTKKRGTLYFFLGIIPIGGPGGGPYNVKGLKVEATYITDEGKWRKTYTAYHDNIRQVVNAIILDFNRLITEKGAADENEGL